MKKQILFLALFILAIFAGNFTVFGQATPLSPGVTATQKIPDLSCIATSEPLHPFAGVPYIYSMDNGSGATSSDWTWWATQDVNFISTTGGVTTTNMATKGLTKASGDLVDNGPTYGVTTPAGAGANEVSITWSAGLLARTKYQATAADVGKASTFVVGYSHGTTCADNIQVYEINPKPNFTIDIAAIDTIANKTLNWDEVGAQCVANVVSSTYNTTSHEIDMDYGKNNFYFEVAAANFVTDWTPTFTIISGLATTQEAVITMYPTLGDAQANTNAIASSGTLTTANIGVGKGWATGKQLTATNIADIATGVSVYVRVTIKNKTEESLTQSPFALAVDAQDNTAAGIWDMEDEDCAGDPTLDKADQIDIATVNIDPRPTLNGTTPDGGAPNPTTTVPKPSTSTGTF
jgi:hypothetical protein